MAADLVDSAWLSLKCEPNMAVLVAQLQELKRDALQWQQMQQRRPLRSRKFGSGTHHINRNMFTSTHNFDHGLVSNKHHTDRRRPAS